MHRGKRWSLHWSDAHLYAKWVESSVSGGREGRRRAMQRSANLPYACWSQRRQPLFLQGPFVCWGESVSHSMQTRRRGGQFCGGALISIALTQKKLQPLFSYWNNSAKEECAKTQRGWAIIKPKSSPGLGSLSNRAAVKEVNEVSRTKCCCKGTYTSDSGRCLQGLAQVRSMKKKGHPRLAKYGYADKLVKITSSCADSSWYNLVLMCRTEEIAS